MVVVLLAACTGVATAQPCSPADFTGDGTLDFFDVSSFLNAFASGDLAADMNDDTVLDFFDVSSFLNTFAAGCPTEIVLRDSIGPDNSSTNGLAAAGFEITSAGGGSYVAIDLSGLQAMTLSTLRVILVNGGVDPVIQWQNKDYVLMLWDSYAEAQIDPLCQSGDTCQQIVLDTPTAGPTSFGSTAIDFLGARTTYEVTFDLSQAGLVVENGQSLFIGFAIRDDTVHGDLLGVMEAIEAEPFTDRGWISTQGWDFTSNYSWMRADGRLAISISGIAIP